MSFEVQIRRWPAPVAVETGGTILEAALDAGVPYPHGCRSGNCGACKSRLYRGDVEMSPYSEFALTDDEKAQGLILACRAVPWSDAEIGWLEDAEVVVHPRRRLDCRVVAIEDATHDIKRFRLEILSGGPFTFSAGQYAEVRFEGQPKRDYSMANRPDEALLEFHVRRVEGGTASRHAAERLKLGDHVEVEGPFGSSWLRENHTGPILAAAGGSGLAPVKSIVETALARGMRQPIRFYFGARAERDIYLMDDFAALAARHPNLQIVPVLSEPAGPAGPIARRTGYLADAIAADLADLDGWKVYLAGPPVMVETVTEAARARGARREDIHADAFYTEADKAKLEAAR